MKAFLLEESNVSTVFLALELLDNLPHDKSCHNRVSQHLEQGEVHAVQDQINEVFVPLEDPFLSEILLYHHMVPRHRGARLGYQL